MEIDNIKIISKKIFGINNPKIDIVLEIMNNDEYAFEFCVDNKKIDYECRILENDSKIEISANIDKKMKHIVVYAVSKKEKKILCKMYNSKLLRVINKIGDIIKHANTKIKIVFYIIGKGIKFMWREYHFLVPISMWGKYFKDFVKKIKYSSNRFYNPFYVDEYNKWLINNKEKIKIEEFEYNPLISILIPVYNIKKELLEECLNSILKQTYKNYEVCLVDDMSTINDVRTTLEKYKDIDSRIKVKYRKVNGHISKTTNDALSMAKGEYIALMDNDDTIDENALYEIVKVLNEDKKIDFIYTDEDKINLKGKYCDPHFKPDFSPDTLLSLNYICHFSVIRKKIVDKVGGFEVGLEGAQDHDLFLKVSEITDRIYHIPKILYHWRMVEGSTSMKIENKSYALDKGKIAIENALKRRKIQAHVEKDEISTYYRVVYEIKKEPLVSIIIPTRDYVDILKKCIDSIYAKTTYKNFEIIVANNDSKEEETLSFFNSYKKKYKNFKVIDCIMEFNYSKINNIVIEKCRGEYVILLNNDTEIITPEWITYMIGYASQKHVGCVGAKLLYEDYTVQHGGVILGLGGVASHAYIGATRSDTGIYGRLRVPYNYAANTAACLAVKKSKYLEVHGLDENLKVAYNDIDFNIRLLEKGYYNVFLPQVELIHYESKSRGLDTTSEKYTRFLKESKYMYDKWGDIINNDPFYNNNFSKKGWFMLDKK